MFQKVIITGASGFIGKCLTRKLLEEGTAVTAVVRNENNMSDLRVFSNLTVVECNFSDYAKLPELIQKADYDVFFHLAWAGYGKQTNDYTAQIENIKPACDALVSAKQLGCKRFLFSSSFSEYMIVADTERRHADGAPSNVYGSTKEATRRMLQAVALQQGISFVAIGFSNTFGPGDTSNRSTNLFVRRLLQGQDLDLTPGTGLYDWNYIDDALNAVVLAAEHGKEQEMYYILGNVRPLKDIVLEMRDIINPNCKVHLGTYSESFGLDYSSVDVNKLYRDTGYLAVTPFADAIRATAKWIQQIDGLEE